MIVTTVHAHVNAYSTVFVKASSFVNRDLAGIVAVGGEERICRSGEGGRSSEDQIIGGGAEDGRGRGYQ